jgi:hypothetical protein
MASHPLEADDKSNEITVPPREVVCVAVSWNTCERPRREMTGSRLTEHECPRLVV